MRFFQKVSLVLLSIFIIYFLGPSPKTPHYKNNLPLIPTSTIELENFITKQEGEHKIKPNNQARIVWANDSNKVKTEYAIVYLHGFSASQEEGNPVHKKMAQQFGCNLYLSRLSQHGIDTSESLVNMTAENLWESAKQAYAIGKQLGKKIILMSTSTGGTLSLKLAAEYPEIAGLILYSPNIAIKDGKAVLLNNPWGLQIAKWVKGSNYNVVNINNPKYDQYWNKTYRLEATVELESLLETTMNRSTFEKVKQPTLCLYYFKDENHQDNVVNIEAIKKMMNQLGTSNDKKQVFALPNVENHVIASPILSKDITSVERKTVHFLQNVMHLNSIQN